MPSPPATSRWPLPRARAEHTLLRRGSVARHRPPRGADRWMPSGLCVQSSAQKQSRLTNVQPLGAAECSDAWRPSPFCPTVVQEGAEFPDHERLWRRSYEGRAGRHAARRCHAGRRVAYGLLADLTLGVLTRGVVALRPDRERRPVSPQQAPDHGVPALQACSPRRVSGAPASARHPGAKVSDLGDVPSVVLATAITMADWLVRRGLAERNPRKVTGGRGASGPRARARRRSTRASARTLRTGLRSWMRLSQTSMRNFASDKTLHGLVTGHWSD